MRIWLLAERLGIPSAVVIDLLRAEGEHVSSHLSNVPAPLLARVIANAPPPAPVETPARINAPTTPTPARNPQLRPAPRPWHPQRRPGPEPVTLKHRSDDDDDDWYHPERAFRRLGEATTRDVTSYFRVKPAVVRQWVARGYLTPTRKLRGSNVFDVDEVLRAWDEISERRSAKARTRWRNPDPSNRRPGMSIAQFERLNRVYPDRLITLNEAAAMTGVAPATIRTWIHRGRLTPHPSSRPRALLFRIRDLHTATRGHH